MASTSTSPLTLVPGGQREVVDETKAQSIVSTWKSQLIQHKAQLASSFLPTSSAKIALENVTLCNAINLSDKSYTREAAVVIADFLTSTDVAMEVNGNGGLPLASSIQYANLADIIAGRMTEEGLDVLLTITNAFLTSPLIDLDLSDNAIGQQGLPKIKALFHSPLLRKHLKKLSFCNNGLSEASMAQVADLLTESLENEEEGSCIARQLTKIHFYNNMSGDQGCVEFQRILECCSDSITDVRFSGTRAKSKGSKVLCTALESLGNDGKLKNLERLDLADNTFSECFESFSSSLSQSSKLTYLNVRDCVLKDEGIASVCSTLQEAGCSLTHLDMSGNEIEADGAKDVASLLKNNTSIQTLWLEENEMTSKGVKYIAKALASCPEVETIGLTMNECGKVGGTALVTVAPSLNKLKSITLDQNMFPEDVVDALTEAYGEKLAEMEDNDDEDDVDEDYETDEEDDVDDLAGAVAGLKM